MIEVTKPDGSITNLGPFTAGMTGGVATSFTPDQIGDYSIRSIYPGEVSTLTNPYNDDPSTADYHPELLGSTFLPATSPAVTLTVQQDPVQMQYQTPPVPDYYWTRPVFATNWNWGTEVASNWYGLDSTGFTTTGKYDVIGGFDPYGEAPNSPHILWSKQLPRFGGQPGEPIPSDQSTQFTSTDITVDQYDGSIIVGGILYYTKYSGWGAGKNYIEGWEAVNLRTGETLWERPAGLSGSEFLRYGQVYRWHNPQGYGSHAFLWSIDSEGSSIFGPSGDMVFRIYDAATGKHLANITTEAGEADTSTYARNLSCLTDIDGQNPGGLLAYYTQGDELIMWNSTKIVEGFSSTGGERSSLGYGDHAFSEGVQWNISRTLNLNGEPVRLGLSRVTRDILLLSTRETFRFQGTQFGWTVLAGVDSHTGQVLWGPVNQTRPFLVDMNLVCAREGYWFEYDSDNHEAYGYNLHTGQRLWGPIAVPFDAYSSQNVWGDIAYGKVFFNGGGGIVNCMDLATGELEWSWSRGTSGYDTPFGIYPIFGYRTQTICDGKLFISEGYLYTPPLHPARRIVLDCETGDLVWSILSYSSRASGAHADSCFVEHNAFDNRIYTFGKGPSELTVTANPKVSTLGSSVLVEGTVMDVSPGTETTEMKLRFPGGVPVVADEGMREWMEFVYMQQNCPEMVQGVTVKIEAVDPNYNYQDYGTTHSDFYGNFALAFEPEVPGMYMIMATFEGTESYYRSYASTWVQVDEATPGIPIEPEEPTEPEEPVTPLITTEIAIIAAVAIIAVVGIAAYWLLRKRQ
jgi:hypothetical protein